MTAVKFGPRNGGTYRARAHEKWGDHPPEWVLVLAAAADGAASQQELADKLGVSASAVSAVIANAYPGRTDNIETRVRGELMREKVQCPVMFEISRRQCMDFQKLPFATCSPTRAQLYYACRKPCVHFMGGSK